MKSFASLLCLWLLVVQVHASHLRGGYVRAKSVGGLQYEITVTLYADQLVNSDDEVFLCFGDGTTRQVVRSGRVISNDRLYSISTYRAVHTYAGPGTYTLTTTLPNRTVAKNIVSSTDQGLLVLTTTFSTNASANQTPAFLFPENGFQVVTSQRLIFPLKTTDADGDSLTYGLTRPLTSNADNTCTSRPVATYQYPNNLTRRGTFTLNNRTGILIWDAPVEPGNYCVAITVGEQRNGVLISQTQIEVLLVVIDKPGTPSPIPPYEPALEGGIVTALPVYRDEDVVLTVFPNPVDDQLRVVVQSSNPASVRMQLLDGSGRTLHNMSVGRLARHHEQVMSMDNLTPGLYVLRVDVGDRTLTRKVIKR